MLYKNDVAGRIMSRNRFELLLRFWHFDNDAQNNDSDKIFKIKILVDSLNDIFSNLKEPAEKLAIDETIIPFRGRLGFSQYIPNKRHKYGIKLFKVCDPEAYTYRISIYQGKSENKIDSLSKKVVLDISANYIDQGRTLITDIYYTSVDLANELVLICRTNFLHTLHPYVNQ